MFDVVKRLLKHSIVYAIATVLNRAVSIIMLPIYTRYLSKSEYGALELFLVTSSVIMFVLQLGMGSALFRSVIYRQSVNRRVLTSTAHYFLVVFSLISTLVLITFAAPISKMLLGTVQYTFLLRLLFVGDFFLIFAVIPMAVLRIDERSGLFALIAGANFIIGIALNVLFLIVLRKGLYGVILAMTLNAAAFALIYSFVILKDLLFTFSRTELADMLGYGLPLVPASIFVLLINMADRYFIRYFMGLDHVAVYGAAARISMIISLIVNAFQMAWPAVLFSIAKEPEGPHVFARLFNYFNALLLFFSLALAMFAHDLLAIIATNNYVGAAPMVSLLVLSSIFFGINYFTSIGIQVEKKTLYYPLLIGVAAIFNIVICIVGIPIWGLWGAGIAKLISFTFLGVSICFVSLKYYTIPFQFRKIALAYAIAIAGYLAGMLADSSTLAIPIKLLIIGLFVVSLFLVGLVDLSHIRHMKKSMLPYFSRTNS
ncbi:oligosaccharide flippase family protein [candidate division KSB1 bacterium]|nr:oligosaccharide flippase family protein [candidate division KSB1 bacterium]